MNKRWHLEYNLEKHLDLCVELRDGKPTYTLTRGRETTEYTDLAAAYAEYKRWEAR